MSLAFGLSRATIPTRKTILLFSEDRMKMHPAVIVATWFWSGLIPSPFPREMAGTYGSIAALPLSWGAIWASQKFGAFEPNFPSALGAFVYFCVCYLVYWLGIWSVPRAEARLGSRRDYKGRWRDHDQNQIVVDEVLGMLVACFPLLFFPFGRKMILGSLAAFGLFRLFDITKVPPPIRYFDRMHTPEGVMLDDAFAGAWAAVFIGLGVIWAKFG